MDLSGTWQECCITSLDVHGGTQDNSCSANFAGVMALDTYNFYTLVCLLISYLISLDLNGTWQECCTTSLDVHMGR